MEPHSGQPKLPWFKNNKKLLLLGVILSVVILVPIIVYYELSYNSVNGTTIQIASVKRTVNTGFFGGISSVTYSVEAHVWSYATSLNTVVKIHHSPL
jgi:predicted negative regulator of RcsB-dependent stress response